MEASPPRTAKPPHLKEKRGWLFKKGSTRATTWRRRFFVLDPRNLSLAYYKEIGDDKPKGIIRLFDVAVQSGDSGKKKQKFVFTISSKNPAIKRVYVIKASFEEEMQGWVTAIRQAMQHRKQQTGGAGAGNAGGHAPRPPSGSPLHLELDPAYKRAIGIPDWKGLWREPASLKGLLSPEDTLSTGLRGRDIPTFRLRDAQCIHRAFSMTVHNSYNAVAVGAWHYGDDPRVVQLVGMDNSTGVMSVQSEFTASEKGAIADVSWYDSTLLCATSQGLVHMYEASPKDKQQARDVSGAFRAPKATFVHSKHTKPGFASPGGYPPSTRVHRIEINPIDKKSFLSLANCDFHVWDLQNPGAPIHAETGSTQPLFACAWSQHSAAQFAIGGARNSIKVLDGRLLAEDSGKCVAWKVNDAHSDAVQDLAFSPLVEHWIASCADDGVVKVWDRRYGTKPVRELRGHGNSVKRVSWSRAHCELLLSCGVDETMRLWNLRQGPECRAYTTQPEDFEDGVVGCAFSPCSPVTMFGVSGAGEVVALKGDDELLSDLTPHRLTDGRGGLDSGNSGTKYAGRDYWLLRARRAKEVAELERACARRDEEEKAEELKAEEERNNHNNNNSKDPTTKSSESTSAIARKMEAEMRAMDDEFPARAWFPNLAFPHLQGWDGTSAPAAYSAEAGVCGTTAAVGKAKRDDGGEQHDAEESDSDNDGIINDEDVSGAASNAHAKGSGGGVLGGLEALDDGGGGLRAFSTRNASGKHRNAECVGLERKIERMLYARDFGAAFAAIAQLAERYWADGQHEWASSLLQLTNPQMFTANAKLPDGLFDGDQQQSQSSTTATLNCEPLQLAFGVMLERLVRSVPPNSIKATNVLQADLRAVHFLQTRLQLTRLTQNKQWKEILGVQDEVLFHIEQDGDAFDGDFIEKMVRVLLPVRPVQALQFALHVAQKLQAADAFRHFVRTAALVLSPTVYHSKQEDGFGLVAAGDEDSDDDSDNEPSVVGRKGSGASEAGGARQRSPSRRSSLLAVPRRNSVSRRGSRTNSLLGHKRKHTGTASIGGGGGAGDDTVKTATLMLERDLRNPKIVIGQLELLTKMLAECNDGSGNGDEDIFNPFAEEKDQPDAAAAPAAAVADEDPLGIPDLKSTSAKQIVALMEAEPDQKRILPALAHKVYLKALLKLRNYDKVFILGTGLRQHLGSFEFGQKLDEILEKVANPAFQLFLDKCMRREEANDATRLIAASLTVVNILFNCPALPPALEADLNRRMGELLKELKAALRAMATGADYKSRTGNPTKDAADKTALVLRQVAKIRESNSRGSKTSLLPDLVSQLENELRSLVF